MIEGIPSKTALGPALRKAIESMKPAESRLCYDPFAHYFITPRTTCVGESCWPRWLVHFLYDHLFEVGIAGFILVRTRWMDDWLTRSLSEGFEQFVNLGAGYDTRPGSLLANHPEIAVFELDFPATQEHKRSLLEKIPDYPQNRIHFVPVDFTQDSFIERLCENGYDPTKKTFFLWEGVTYYLEEPDVVRTLEAIRDFSAPKSRILFDYINAPVICRRIPTWHDHEEPLRWALPTEEMESFLTRHGFQPLENRPAKEIAQTYFTDKVKKVRVSRFDSLVAADTRR